MGRLISIAASAGVIEDIDGFDPDRTFKENGVDSLDVMTVLLRIEEELGVKFAEQDDERMLSLRDVLRVLQGDRHTRNPSAVA